MTGFGRATGSFQSKKVTVEIRSLNSKSMDLNTRIPSQYKELDSTLRKQIGHKLGRGKVDVSITIDDIGSENAVSINRSLAKTYYNELKSLNDELGNPSPDYLSLILRMPDIYSNTRDEITPEEQAWLIDLAQKAVENLDQFRTKEGEELAKEFVERIEGIRAYLNEVPRYEQERIEVIRERMMKALEELKGESYDDNRFEQEMIFYIEKLDVSEEKMRLSNHLDYFLETMNQEQAGKKLGFISQEIGREINTLGSKSNHAEMQRLVIDMKDNLEQIKEQILNTL